MCRAEDMIKRYGFNPHEENGIFTERHYASPGPERPASGCIYYYVRPGERTEFHVIDCDEYWSRNAGSTLELWVIGTDGRLRLERLGIEDGAEPTLRFAAGEIFASRLSGEADDGAFVTCITVPRFTYAGFRMLGREEVTALCPEASAFWE